MQNGNAIIESGLYIISEAFFNDFPDQNLMGNKNQNRPHYCAIKDKKTGLFWMIPLSSRVAKYQAIIEKRRAENKPNDLLHIARLDNGSLNVFLIQNMFPVTAPYIEREYLLAGTHFCVTSQAEMAVIRSKAMRVLNLVHRGVKFGFQQADVLEIERHLLNGTTMRD